MEMIDGRTRGARAAGFGLSLAVVVGCGGGATAELLTGWNFDNVESGSLVVDATVGGGVLDLGTLQSVSTTFQGTTLNALDTWDAGDALAFAGAPPEGGGMTLSLFEVTGPVDVSFAARRSETGARWVDAELWDGWGWVPMTTFDISTDWAVHAVEIDAVPGSGRLFVRLTPAGTTSSGGTIRFDNLRVDGVVPAPGGLALAAFGAGLRRRRRHG